MYNLLFIVHHLYDLAVCPTMVTPPVNTTVLPGATAKFICLAHSYSGLFYAWGKSNGDLSSVTRKTISQHQTYVGVFGRYGRQTSLAISNVSTPDEGWYCCYASNECGRNTTRCAWLEVNSKNYMCIN